MTISECQTRSVIICTKTSQYPAGTISAGSRSVNDVSQKRLADMLQLLGLDLDKNAIQRIESGKRFVTDIELRYFAKVLNVSYEELLSEDTPEAD